MLSVTLDVAGPGLLIGLGVIVGGLASVVIVIAEALVLWQLKWAGFWRSLFVSLMANIASAIAGIFWTSFYVIRDIPFDVIFLVVSFLASIVIEAGVLMLLKRGANQENWRAALLINLASYALILLIVAAWYAY